MPYAPSFRDCFRYRFDNFMAQDIESNPLYKVAVITAGVVGMILLSMLIGLITTALDHKTAWRCWPRMRPD
jgi:hypothetical protein